MSEQGIDAYRVTSVLGYCLLPMVGVGAVSVMFTLKFAFVLSPFASAQLMPSQWSFGIFAQHPFHNMVYERCLGYLRRGAANVKSTAARRISRRFVIRLLRPSQRFPYRWWWQHFWEGTLMNSGVVIFHSFTHGRLSSTSEMIIYGCVPFYSCTNQCGAQRPACVATDSPHEMRTVSEKLQLC